MVPFSNAKCKYCGKRFYKTANKTCYCSDRCRTLALREQKAEYQRKRRKLIRDGVLVAPNEKASNDIGTGYIGEHRNEDELEELNVIRRELRRLRIKRW
ncbi:MAG: hypothetical protein J6T69_02605 [Methanobrevibacter sp.]|nr:hypothetical protein [Methanobrevibacter sp.]